MAQRYNPPKQSIAGQFFDVVFLLALVFLALFLPIWLEIAVPSRVEKLPDGVTYTAATPTDDQDLDRSDLGGARPEPDDAGAVGEARLHRRRGAPTSSPSRSTTRSTPMGIFDHRAW